MLKTLFEVPTTGDEATLPGGIALRACPDTGEFVVHYYSTDRESHTQRHYFQGSYFTHDGYKQNAGIAFAGAVEEFSRRAQSVSKYTLGGSLNLTELLKGGATS